MTTELDLIIRNGLVVDGSGKAPFEADVAVASGRIAAVGKVAGRGRDEIDARGAIVTPGFVDLHTHFDGQATWGKRMSPSSSHGVTTVIMGNCGVGFAPCRPGDRDDLVRLMEGVEDIPGVVMNEGLPWNWETFPDYLNVLDRGRYDIDVAAQLPHAPLRVYVMGQRGLDREPAKHDDLVRMSEIAKEAVAAGALGFSTSRSLNHRSSDHHLMPGVSAAEGELTVIGLGAKAGGASVLQMILDFEEPEADFAMMRRIAEKTRMPLSFTLLQAREAPDRWRRVLDWVDEANREGVPIKAQVFIRPIGVVAGMEMSFNPFSFCPSYARIAKLPVADRLTAMRNPELRAQLISEYPTVTLEPISRPLSDLENMFVMADPPVYEPSFETSIAAEARRLGVSPRDHAYDLTIADGGKTILYIPAANYVDGTSNVTGAMIRSDNTLIGLGDGGAHVGMICDASQPTYLLTRWLGEDKGGLSLPKAIQALSHDNARAVGLNDRGLVAQGYRADLNIIDLDRLHLYRPSMVHDLPGGGGRLDQRADGYVATIVNGVVTRRDGAPTDVLPGRLVRGMQPAP